MVSRGLFSQINGFVVFVCISVRCMYVCACVWARDFPFNFVSLDDFVHSHTITHTKCVQTGLVEFE